MELHSALDHYESDIGCFYIGSDSEDHQATIVSIREAVNNPIDIVAKVRHDDHVQFGKDVLANYITTNFDKITEVQFEEYSQRLEQRMLENNGEVEVAVAEEMFDLNNEESVTARAKHPCNPQSPSGVGEIWNKERG